MFSLSLSGFSAGSRSEPDYFHLLNFRCYSLLHVAVNIYSQHFALTLSSPPKTATTQDVDYKSHLVSSVKQHSRGRRRVKWTLQSPISWFTKNNDGFVNT